MLTLIRPVFFLAIVRVSFGQHETNCAENREAIIHLFEWTWTDVAAECERFLAPRGYCGVQVSPPSEHVVVTDPMRPWWERYQPVSYIMESRSGTREEFIDMVERCNAVNVRIYPDAVINHMSGTERTGSGIAGSEFDGASGWFPAAGYDMGNFNGCENCGDCCCISDYGNHAMVRDCRLLTLIDLDTGNANTQTKIIEFLNDMIDIGVAGFRVDAAKHIWPNQMEDISDRLHDLDARWFSAGSRPFLGLEVIDLGATHEVGIGEYIHIGRVTEFRFCNKIESATYNLWEVEDLYDPDSGMASPGDAFVFVDNHDNQRGHGGGGSVVTHKDPRRYKMAQAIMLGFNYGFKRVMSSYFFDDSEAGPPHNEDYTTKEVIINEDGSCGNGWVCEHRWAPIAGMAGFAKATHDESYQQMYQEGNAIAWSRGDKGFIAVTNEGGMDMTLQTGLPAGTYCDVITGCSTDESCTGKIVEVKADGTADVSVTNVEEPMLAIHVEALAGSGGCEEGAPSPTQGPTTTTELTPSTTRDPTGNWQRTIIFMYARTAVGEDIFFRGGIDHDVRPGCTEDAQTSACAIPIRHVALGSGDHYEKMNAWRIGDDYFDWYGAEVNQGTWYSRDAEGTPAVWTTDDPSHDGYQPENQWGEHYWKVEFDMDCDDTEDGWFEIKAYMSQGAGWETDISQGTCQGTVGGSSPYSSNNHFGMCGHLNRFSFSDDSCYIDAL